jgi:hypothetical protein
LIFDVTRTRAGSCHISSMARSGSSASAIGALVATVSSPDLRTIPRSTPIHHRAQPPDAQRHDSRAVRDRLCVASSAIVALDKTRWGRLALSAVAVAFLLAAMWLETS